MEKFYPKPLNFLFINGRVVIFVISLMVYHLIYLHAQDSKKDFLQRFVLGEYVLIGKKINSDDTYFGAATIKL